MPQLQGVVFDMDGTLMDSAADLRRALNTVLKAHHRRDVTQDEVKSMVGDGMGTLMSRAFTATGEALSEADEALAFKDFLRLYQTQGASKDSLYPLAEETLRKLHHKGIKIGMCTNKLYMATMSILNEVGIAEYFDFVGGGDSFSVCKPHPAHVLGVVDALHVPAENCVMIGDSINDIRAAVGAKVTCIALGHGYGVEIEKLHPNIIIPSFAELDDAFEKLGFTL